MRQTGGKVASQALHDARPRTGATDAAILMAELRTALAYSADLSRSLDEVRRREVVMLQERIAELELRQVAAEAERHQLAARLASAERDAGRLMELYVALFQLHATLAPSKVAAAIVEVAVDILGAQRFLLLLRDQSSRSLHIALSHGLEESEKALYEGEWAGEPQGALAVVPLKAQGQPVGYLVLLKLLDHRSELGARDRELLELLGEHAAAALLAARAYSASRLGQGG